MINLSLYLFISGYISSYYYQNELRTYINNNEVDYIFIIYFFSTYIFSYIFYLMIKNMIYFTTKIVGN